MEFTLEYRLKVGLHTLSCYFYYISRCCCLLPTSHLVEVRSDECDLVIFDLRCILCHNQLAAVYTGTVELNLHIAAADDLAFKCRCECNRDIDVCDLDLDISCFKRSSVEFGNVRLNDQALRNSEDVLGLVGDYRETKCDRACTTCYDNIGSSGCKCIYKCRYTFHGVFHQALLHHPAVTLPKIRAARTATDTTWITRCNIFAQRDRHVRLHLFCSQVLHTDR